jgi:fumarate reductase subunit C
MWRSHWQFQLQLSRASQTHYNIPEQYYNFITIAQNPLTIVLTIILQPSTHSQSYYNSPEAIDNHITTAQEPLTIILQLPWGH